MRLRSWIAGALLAAAALVPCAGELSAAPASALHVVTAPAAATKSTKGGVVSPYARAAAAHNGSGQLAAGHSATLVQGMGHRRKAHAGGTK